MKEPAAANVRRLKRTDVENLIALYQRAFWDDPAIEFMLPDERTRGRTMDAYMNVSTPVLFIAMFTIGFIGLLMGVVLRILQRRVLAWKTKTGETL